MVPILLDKEVLTKTTEYLLKTTIQTGTAIYTGSKSTEYFNSKAKVSLSEACLFSILNQRPELIRILRLAVSGKDKKVLMASSIPE